MRLSGSRDVVLQVEESRIRSQKKTEKKEEKKKHNRQHAQVVKGTTTAGRRKWEGDCLSGLQFSHGIEQGKDCPRGPVIGERTERQNHMQKFHMSGSIQKEKSSIHLLLHPSSHIHFHFFSAESSSSSASRSFFIFIFIFIFLTFSFVKSISHQFSQSVIFATFLPPPSTNF